MAVCELVAQTGMSFTEAERTPMVWVRRWRLYHQLTRPDPPAPALDDD